MTARTLVVSLDGSTVSEAALPYAEALARASGYELALLSVVERYDPVIFTAVPAVLESIMEERRDSLGAYLDSLVADLEGRGLQVTPVLVEGRPAEEILALADQVDAAAIVMATHGRGGTERFLVGSVADKVMRLATRPVLLVRPGEDERLYRRPVALGTVVVPLDGSDLAEAAIGPAAELAQAAGARLVLLRVEPSVAAIGEGFMLVPDFELTDEAVTRVAEAYLAQASRLVPEQVAVETRAVRGPVPHALLDTLARMRPDLVVMTTRGRGGLRRALLGSVADRVVRSGAPVLLIPARAASAELDGAEHVVSDAVTVS
jgi:nucleotide-binding universal stress UspA family protein